MVQITLTNTDLLYLRENYPSLRYSVGDNIISGTLFYDLSYQGVRIKDSYNIQFELSSNDNSILPIVNETEGKILSIAKRKRIPESELHLNNTQGELCIIIPPKEKEKYPDGFNLKIFLGHIEEHLYWISFYDRYEKPPWKDQAHGTEGFIELYRENTSYRTDVKKELERLVERPLNRPELRRIIKKWKLS